MSDENKNQASPQNEKSELSSQGVDQGSSSTGQSYGISDSANPFAAQKQSNVPTDSPYMVSFQGAQNQGMPGQMGMGSSMQASPYSLGQTSSLQDQAPAANEDPRWQQILQNKQQQPQAQYFNQSPQFQSQQFPQSQGQPQLSNPAFGNQMQQASTQSPYQQVSNQNDGSLVASAERKALCMKVLHRNPQLVQTIQDQDEIRRVSSIYNLSWYALLGSVPASFIVAYKERKSGQRGVPRAMGKINLLTFGTFTFHFYWLYQYNKLERKMSDKYLSNYSMGQLREMSGQITHNNIGQLGYQQQQMQGYTQMGQPIQQQASFSQQMPTQQPFQTNQYQQPPPLVNPNYNPSSMHPQFQNPHLQPPQAALANPTPAPAPSESS